MTIKDKPSSPSRRSGERGMTLIETVIALAILLIITTGLMALGVVATITTENQGHLAARTTEYAQDKMEQLTSLAWSDQATDTFTYNPPTQDCIQFLINASCASGGTGLAPVAGTVAARTAKYVDFLNVDGTPLGTCTGAGCTPPSGWFYERRWEITAVTGTLKKIDVWCTTRAVIGDNTTGLQPQATLSSYKTSPF